MNKQQVLRIVAQGIEDGLSEPLTVSLIGERVRVLVRDAHAWRKWSGAFGFSRTTSDRSSHETAQGRRRYSVGGDGVEVAFLRDAEAHDDWPSAPTLAPTDPGGASMAAFTDDDLAYLRARLGSIVNEDTNAAYVDELQDRYDRLGTVPLVVVEVLQQRLADIADPLTNPLNFNIVGEYSQDGSGNAAFLKQALADAMNEAGVTPPGSTLTAVRAPRSRWRR